MGLSLSARYTIEEELGTGGMGTVYRAKDNLTQNVVALKSIEFFSRSDDPLIHELRLAMGREFQLLASLRHPHIINVLDFGFDQKQNPYFTMDLLRQPQNLLEASKEASLQEKVRMLIAVLQALHYVHRRGVVHLDLKPDNILISKGQLRVLDFGLATLNTATETGGWVPAGTLFYMAPETLNADTPPGPAADLYAVGVMAYQLLLGKIPFSGNGRLSKLVQEILETEPDLSDLDAYPDLQRIIGRLLAKDPAARYDNALDVIDDLNATLDTPVPLETREMRESFLQASKFVGREKELAQLLDGLEMAIAGHGTAWLVGGEIGVGKSRLLDELQIQAHVKGIHVLFGQGIAEGGGLPFQLWREPLRRLVLESDVDDLAAGVLSPLIPDIGRLLGRAIPPTPQLDGPAGQQRLMSTIARLFAQQQQPILLILEDLQWVSESLLILQQLIRVLDTLPLLIVGSYRSDEKPDLPEALLGMQVMMLERLSGEDIASLSESMLGENGRRPDLLDLLQRETEGNAFFLVEVVRALAEQAGYLRAVGQTTLPTQVFTGGVDAVIQRRLARIPQEGKPVLNVAAVLGRQLDLHVLNYLTESKDVAHCLQRCGDIAVFEVREGHWRFAHERLREGVLKTLTDEERTALHQQVAKAIEHVYPNDANYAASLVYHWHQAGDVAKERQYARIAGEHALAQYANSEALTHFSRALALTPETNLTERYALLSLREGILHTQGKRQEQSRDLAALAEIADAAADPRWQAEVALHRSRYASALNAYDDAITTVQQAVAMAQRVQADDLIAQAELAWSNVLQRQGNNSEAQVRCERAIDIFHQLNQTRPLAQALRAFGQILYQQGEAERAQAILEGALQISDQNSDRQTYGTVLAQLSVLIGEYQNNPTLAKTYLERARQIFHEIGSISSELTTLNNLGVRSRSAGEYDQARTYFEQIVPLQREIGSPEGVGLAQANLGLVAHLLGDYAGAETHYRNALNVMEDLGSNPHAATLRFILGIVFMDKGNLVEAHSMLKRGLEELHNMGIRMLEGEAIENLGWLACRTGDFPQAQAYFQQGRDMNTEMGQTLFAISCTAGLARALLAQGHQQQAQIYVDEVLAFLAQNPTLEGHDFSFRILWACIEVLQTLNDPRAPAFLSRVHTLLQERAAKIADEAMRHSFLENVAAHRDIAQHFQLHHDTAKA